VSGELLYGISEWVLFVAVAGLFYLSAEAGYRYAQRFGARGCAEPHGHVATIENHTKRLAAMQNHVPELQQDLDKFAVPPARPGPEDREVRKQASR
jgi:hypothetical protein